MNLAINKIEKKDIPKLKNLFENAFNIKISDDFLYKLFDTNYTKRSYIGYYAIDLDKDIFAAYFGGYPCLIKQNNEIIDGLQIATIMTHSDYRRLGLFVKLAIETHKFALNNGIKAIFGLPNPTAYPGYIKHLGWKHETNVNEYRIKIITFPLAKLVFFAPTFIKKLYNKLAFKLTTLFFKKGEKFLGSISENQIGFLRNSAYFEYKNSSDKKLISINSKNLWIKINTSLIIGDIELCSEIEFNKILNKVKLYCALVGITDIKLFYSEGTYFNELLAKSYKKHNFIPFAYLPNSEFEEIKNIKMSAADFDTW